MPMQHDYARLAAIKLSYMSPDQVSLPVRGPLLTDVIMTVFMHFENPHNII